MTNYLSLPKNDKWTADKTREFIKPSGKWRVAPDLSQMVNPQPNSTDLKQGKARFIGHRKRRGADETEEENFK